MSTNPSAKDKRIHAYILATERLRAGDYQPRLQAIPNDDVGRLGLALEDLAHTLELRYREVQKLDYISTSISTGLLLNDVLEKVYQEFRDVIPYNRIGLSLIEDAGQIVRASWAKTDQGKLLIKKGYSAPLAGSSLQNIVETGQPRILNNLEEYLRAKPDSLSTQLIVAEGIRSSLTCPLVANAVPIGFMYFSSIYPDTYTGAHVDIFLKIAAQLSVIVEKSRLVSELASQKEAIERQHEDLRRLYAQQDEYLREARRVTEAASSVEAGTFELASLDEVAQRVDALGTLARVFQNMAREVFRREQHLREQLQELQIKIDEDQRSRQVTEITDTDDFRDLQAKARALRTQKPDDPDVSQT